MKQTSGGGKPIVKPLPYDPPKGPKGIEDPKGPGLGGTNHGTGQQKG